MRSLERSTDSEHARERLVHPNKLLRLGMQTVSAGSRDETQKIRLTPSSVFVTNLSSIGTLIVTRKQLVLARVLDLALTNTALVFLGTHTPSVLALTSKLVRDPVTQQHSCSSTQYASGSGVSSRTLAILSKGILAELLEILVKGRGRRAAKESRVVSGWRGVWSREWKWRLGDGSLRAL